ncbi:MAG TPA: hypothetical protein VEA99_04475, partial [Gemmatimonadaceae bacterium]|nr:hypothetical protein [Gemmatimonadaceae bacterium]
MLHSAIALLLAIQQQAAAPKPAPRLVITSTARTVVVGDSLQLRAQLVDASGAPVPGVTIRYSAVGAPFEAHVDTLGMVHAGAVGTLPVAVMAIIPGEKPIVERLSIRMLPGPAARIEVASRPTKLMIGQRLRLDARSYSSAGQLRDDRIAWQSSMPAIVQVNAAGLLVARAAGRAVVTARAGDATERVPIEVIEADVASVELSPSQTQARTGDVVRFRAVVRDRAGQEITGLTPTFLFAPGRGEIGPDGAFVAYDPGTYQVTASFGSRTADAVVSVAARDVRRTAKVVGRVPRSQFFTGEVWIHPNGDVAYLTTVLGGDKVYAIDISHPSKPRVVDSLTLNGRTINDIMTTPDGNYAVITREGADNRKNGIVIADTRDPLHPKVLTDFTDGVTAGVHSAFVYRDPKHGQHVYLTNDGTGEVNVVNIDDPAKPKMVASWAPPQSGAGRTLHDIDVQDGLLYGSWWNDGLVILDVGNGIRGGTPARPVMVSQLKYDLNSLYERVEKEGGPGFIRGTHTAWRHRNYVFVGDEVFGNDAANKLFSGQVARAYGRLHVIDVADVTKPRIVA